MTDLKDRYLVMFADDAGVVHTASFAAQKDGRDRAIKFAKRAREAGLAAGIYVPIFDLEPAAVPDWTTDYSAEHREVLRQHGVRPQDHSAAREYNSRLIERAEAGVTGKELADAAAALFDELILERERDEDDYDGCVDWKYELYGAQSERVGVTIVPRKGADHDEQASKASGEGDGRRSSG